MKLKILVTGGGGSATEALYKIWKKKYDLYFCDCNIIKKPVSIPPKKWIKVPLASSKNYIKVLKKVITLYKINLLIPAVDEEVDIISKKRKEFNCDLLMPSHEFINIHKNKWSTNRFLENNKLNFPKSLILKKNTKLLTGPLVIKPMMGRGSKGVRIIDQKKGIERYISKSDRSGKMMIQRKIIGQEYTVMVSSNKKGVVKAIVPVKVIEKKGITILGKTEKNSHVINECFKIHNKFQTPGCYNIQLILDKKKKVYTFEVNPRISTTSCLAIYAGIDIVHIFMNNNPIKNQKKDLKKFKENILLSRSWINSFSVIK